MVPDLVQRSVVEAKELLREVGVTDVRVLTVVSEQPEGIVVSHSPGSGRRLVSSTKVVLRVSGGPSKLEEAGRAEPEPEADGDFSWYLYGFLQVLALVLVGVAFRFRSKVKSG